MSGGMQALADFARALSLDSIPVTELFLASMAIFMASGLLSFVIGGGSMASATGAWGAVAASLTGLLPAVANCVGVAPDCPHVYGWPLPFGEFCVASDPLTAFFMVPLLVLAALAAIYSLGYMGGGAAHGHGEDSGVSPRRIGAYWFFFNLLAASMMLVLLSRNGMLFLIAWELMSVSSFALVAFEHGEASTRRAAWTYLVAAHIGAALLMAMFIILSPDGSLAFGTMDASGDGMATLVFVLALLGFGLKAGFMPLHVWLPEAHPAAPSPVSALMSGIMIKLGIYGIFRVVFLLGGLSGSCGWLLLAVGAVSGIMGVLLALAQQDLKRLLAYSSVENIGIIAIGMGLGIIGLSNANATMAILGFAGALFHALNHAIFKSLLFLCAGAVLRCAGTLRVDSLGGLLKRTPWTGSCFIVGSAAISGLPPLNGFISEFLIYLAAFVGLLTFELPQLVAGVAALLSLGLIGGLATACFARISGTVFLGEARGGACAEVVEAPGTMRGAMLALTVACFATSVLAPAIAKTAQFVVASGLEGVAEGADPGGMALADSALVGISIASCAFFAVFGALALIRVSLPMNSTEGAAGTWDCGYAAPTPRMQYTAQSFAQPLLEAFKLFLRPVSHEEPPKGLFPSGASFSTHTPDMAGRWIVGPCAQFIMGLCGRLRLIQSGYVHLYILYVVAALVLMLVWAFMGHGGAQ